MYRTSVDPEVERQMQLVCQMLYDWRKHNPAIAGGSLWSWAAGRLARDVDIFVKNSRAARKKADVLVRNLSGCDLGIGKEKHTYFSTVEYLKKIKIEAYTSVMDDGTPVDIVLCPVEGIRSVTYFDYNHCMVACSSKEFNIPGVNEPLLHPFSATLAQPFPVTDLPPLLFTSRFAQLDDGILPSLHLSRIVDIRRRWEALGVHRLGYRAGFTAPVRWRCVPSVMVIAPSPRRWRMESVLAILA